MEVEEEDLDGAGCLRSCNVVTLVLSSHFYYSEQESPPIPLTPIPFSRCGYWDNESVFEYSNV